MRNEVMKKDPSHIRFFTLMLILVSLFACAPGVSDPDSWDELLKRQHQELIETSKAVDRLILKLPDRLSKLQKHLYLLRSRFEKLMLYFNLRSGSPLVLKDILGSWVGLSVKPRDSFYPSNRKKPPSGDRWKTWQTFLTSSSRRAVPPKNWDLNTGKGEGLPE